MGETLPFKLQKRCEKSLGRERAEVCSLIECSGHRLRFLRNFVSWVWVHIWHIKFVSRPHQLCCSINSTLQSQGNLSQTHLCLLNRQRSEYKRKLLKYLCHIENAANSHRILSFLGKKTELQRFCMSALLAYDPVGGVHSGYSEF